MAGRPSNKAVDMPSKKEGIVMQILSTYYVGQVVLDRHKGTQTEFERYADNVISLYDRGRMWLELVEKRERAMRKLITKEWICRQSKQYCPYAWAR